MGIFLSQLTLLSSPSSVSESPIPPIEACGLENTNAGTNLDLSASVCANSLKPFLHVENGTGVIYTAKDLGEI